MGNAITTGELKINCSIRIKELLKFEMKMERNNHVYAQIKGIVKEEMDVQQLYRNIEGEEILVIQLDEDGNEDKNPIFGGIIYKAEITQEGKYYTAEITGVSSTILLDTRKRKCSFQDLSMTYSQVVDEVLANTKNASAIYNKNDRKIEKTLIQYDETDWEFIKRIGGNMYTSLIPQAVSKKPQFYFGLTEGKVKGEIHVHGRKISFDQRYYHFAQRSYSKQDFIFYEVKSYELYHMGDRVKLDEKELFVCEISGGLKHGLLEFNYKLGKKEYFAAQQYFNNKLKGISLIGTVLDTKEELVKIHLDIDEVQNKEKAYWYKWMPESGNLMYCMPVVGTTVSLYFNNGDDGSGRCINCLRTNGSGNPEMENYQDRYFTTQDRKRMFMKPESMGFVDLGQPGILQIELEDKKGITIDSNKNISIMAKDTIRLEGKDIFMNAPKEISIIKRDRMEPTVINMCNGFDAIGKYGKVKAKAASSKQFPVRSSSNKGGFDIKGEQSAIIASTPMNNGGTGIEKQIAGSRVTMAKVGGGV